MIKESFQKSIKFVVFTYMIFVKDSPQSAISLPFESSCSSQEEIDSKLFLNEYSNYFMDSIPEELPPSSGGGDHRAFHHLISHPIEYGLPNKKR